jgi:hypothetical protein
MLLPLLRVFDAQQLVVSDMFFESHVDLGEIRNRGLLKPCSVDPPFYLSTSINVYRLRSQLKLLIRPIQRPPLRDCIPSAPL